MGTGRGKRISWEEVIYDSNNVLLGSGREKDQMQRDGNCVFLWHPNGFKAPN